SPRIAVVEPLRGEGLEYPRIGGIARLRSLQSRAPAVRIAILVAREPHLDFGVARRGIGGALLRVQRQPLAVVVRPAPGEQDREVHLRPRVARILARGLAKLS